MSFRSTSRSWEWLAQKDPLWAILTDRKKAGGRWAIDEFFATGEREIATVLGYLERRGLAPPDHDAALDFGCGVGRLSRALRKRFAAVDGVDVSPTMIRLAREHHPDTPGLHFLLNQEPHLGLIPDGKYSFVYSSIVLQHIAYPASLGYVRELMRIAKPGGLVVFQIPTQDRTRAVFRLARWLVRTAVQRARLPFHGLYMEMNVVPVPEILAAARAAGCELVDQARTNSAGADTDGRLDFYTEERGERLVSTQFVFRRSAT